MRIIIAILFLIGMCCQSFAITAEEEALQKAKIEALSAQLYAMKLQSDIEALRNEIAKKSDPVKVDPVVDVDTSVYIETDTNIYGQ